MIRQDFDLIVMKFPTSFEAINIYPIGDVHIGSPEFDPILWHRWKKKVLEDPVGYVVIVGDLLDNGLKTSKTNSYEQTMRPREQKDWLVKELMPLKDRILGSCRGNHEYRSVNESDDCPLYDIMDKLGRVDLYRENMAFLKLNLGYKNKERQYSYTMALAHGQGTAKTEKFSYAIDGMDILVTGHTHTATSKFPAKIVIDSKNETVKMSGYTHITVPSFAQMGGYTLRGMYLPQDTNKIPIITLSGMEKGVSVKWMYL